MAFSLSNPNLNPMSFFGAGKNSRIVSRTRAAGLTGRILLGLGLGGLAAAAYAVVHYFRARTATRTRGNTAATPESGSYAEPEQISMDWIVSGRGMDTLVPAAYSIPEQSTSEHVSRKRLDLLDSGEAAQAATHVPAVDSVFSDPAPGAGSSLVPNPLAQQTGGFDSQPQSEPWTDAVRRAMEKKPLMFGYDKSVWTAPLLSQYLMETHGMAVPVPRLRNALKDMGYHWKHTHYVQARPGTGRHH